MRTKLIYLMTCIFLISCASVKPSERIYLNDTEMQMSNNAAKNYEGYVQSIREAGLSAAGNKSSGGCGCN